MFHHSRARALLCGAAALAALSAIEAEALPYSAEALYLVDSTFVTVPSQQSATDVDILEFTTVNNVGVGIHAYGAGNSFGARSSADFLGTGFAVVQSSFVLDLSGLGSSITLDVTPGEVAVHGPAGGMAIGDVLQSELLFQLVLDNVVVYKNNIVAFLGETSASAAQDLTVDAGVALNLGLSCSASLLDGDASCLVGGGATTLNLDAIAGNSNPHRLIYKIMATAAGQITDFSGCGGSGGGGEVATAALIEEGEGGNGNGGGKSCGAIARSGDPIPEPATFALAPLALVGVAMARRRQRRAD